MFYENIGVPVRSSTKYFAIFGLVLFLGGMGYSAYLAYKERNPSVSEDAGEKKLAVVYPNASIHEMRGFPVTNTEWSPKIKAAEGQEANGMRLCITPGIKWKAGQENGTTVWQFMSVTSQAKVHYQFYQASIPCPPIP